MAITDLEIRMTIKTLAAKGVAKRAIARQLSLSEGTVRYHLRRQAYGAVDGRARQVRRRREAQNARNVPDVVARILRQLRRGDEAHQVDHALEIRSAFRREGAAQMLARDPDCGGECVRA